MSDVMSFCGERSGREPGRGRGRQPDPDRTAQTRDLILRAALASFLERGFEATRMADVAARAGLAKGTLYLHFSDKEALFEFVLGQLVADPVARLRSLPFAPDEGPRVRLERIFLPLLVEFERSGRADVLRLIIAEGGRFPAIAEMHRRLVIEPMLAAIGECLGPAPDGRLATLAAHPHLIGAPVVMSAVWNGLWGKLERIDPAAMLRAFFDLVFGPDEGSGLPSGPADRPAQEDVA